MTSITETIPKNPPFFSINAGGTKWEKCKEITKKVAIVAGLIFAGIVLFSLNPSFFCLGFVLGFIFSAKVMEVSDDVANTSKNLNTWQKVAVTAGLVIGGALALPTTMATISILYASYLGGELREIGNKSKT